MRNEALDQFNDEVIKIALKSLDKDKLAKKLAASIEKKMTEEFESLTDNGLDFEYWITDMLTSDSNPAGKAFNQAIQDITRRMAESIQTKVN